jgi:hypothetical protein
MLILNNVPFVETKDRKAMPTAFGMESGNTQGFRTAADLTDTIYN